MKEELQVIKNNIRNGHTKQALIDTLKLIEAHNGKYGYLKGDIEILLNQYSYYSRLYLLGISNSYNHTHRISSILIEIIDDIENNRHVKVLKINNIGKTINKRPYLYTFLILLITIVVLSIFLYNEHEKNKLYSFNLSQEVSYLNFRKDEQLKVFDDYIVKLQDDLKSINSDSTRQIKIRKIEYIIKLRIAFEYYQNLHMKYLKSNDILNEKEVKRKIAYIIYEATTTAEEKYDPRSAQSAASQREIKNTYPGTPPLNENQKNIKLFNMIWSENFNKEKIFIYTLDSIRYKLREQVQSIDLNKYFNRENKDNLKDQSTNSKYVNSNLFRCLIAHELLHVSVEDTIGTGIYDEIIGNAIEALTFLETVSFYNIDSLPLDLTVPSEPLYSIQVKAEILMHSGENGFGIYSGSNSATLMKKYSVTCFDDYIKKLYQELPHISRKSKSDHATNIINIFLNKKRKHLDFDLNTIEIMDKEIYLHFSKTQKERILEYFKKYRVIAKKTI